MRVEEEKANYAMRFEDIKCNYEIKKVLSTVIIRSSKIELSMCVFCVILLHLKI
jgi:hypothetical protein